MYRCPNCLGAGRHPCPLCLGSGWVKRINPSSPISPFISATEFDKYKLICITCHGHKFIDPCRICDGKGSVDEETYRLFVKIPPKPSQPAISLQHVSPSPPNPPPIREVQAPAPTSPGVDSHNDAKEFGEASGQDWSNNGQRKQPSNDEAGKSGRKLSRKRLLIISVILAIVIGTVIATNIHPQAAGLNTSNAPNVSNPTFPPTAVPSLTPTPSVSYSAYSPGPVCDQGGADWTANSSSILVGCNPHHGSGTEITQLTTTGLPTIDFQWPGHPFPPNYTVGVTMSSFEDANTAGVVLVRKSGNSYYAFFISNGSWWLDRNVNGVQENIANNAFPYAGNLQVEVVVNGDTLALTINGKSFQTITDSSLPTTDMLSLGVWEPNGGGSVVLSNFI